MALNMGSEGEKQWRNTTKRSSDCLIGLFSAIGMAERNYANALENAVKGFYKMQKPSYFAGDTWKVVVTLVDACKSLSAMHQTTAKKMNSATGPSGMIKRWIAEKNTSSVTKLLEEISSISHSLGMEDDNDESKQLHLKTLSKQFGELEESRFQIIVSQCNQVASLLNISDKMDGKLKKQISSIERPDAFSKEELKKPAVMGAASSSQPILPIQKMKERLPSYLPNSSSSKQWAAFGKRSQKSRSQTRTIEVSKDELKKTAVMGAASSSQPILSIKKMKERLPSYLSNSSSSKQWAAFGKRSQKSRSQTRTIEVSSFPEKNCTLREPPVVAASHNINISKEELKKTAAVMGAVSSSQPILSIKKMKERLPSYLPNYSSSKQWAALEKRSQTSRSQTRTIEGKQEKAVKKTNPELHPLISSSSSAENCPCTCDSSFSEINCSLREPPLVAASHNINISEEESKKTQVMRAASSSHSSLSKPCAVLEKSRNQTSSREVEQEKAKKCPCTSDHETVNTRELPKEKVNGTKLQDIGDFPGGFFPVNLFLTAKEDHQGSTKEELSFRKGQKIKLKRRPDENGIAYGWKRSFVFRKKYGFFPIHKAL